MFPLLLLYLSIVSLCHSEETSTDFPDMDCGDLRPGQYYCSDPKIDDETQQAENCTKEFPYVYVPCLPVKGMICNGIKYDGETVGFTRKVPCTWTSGKKFSVALLLSIFLGWCGIDRFYLGYPALGLVKFCTVGFMMLGSFIDVLLIATQVVGPSDGSAYIVDYFGQGLIRISPNNYTYIKPPDYG